jgi:hypothetical protein
MTKSEIAATLNEIQLSIDEVQGAIDGLFDRLVNKPKPKAPAKSKKAKGSKLVVTSPHRWTPLLQFALRLMPPVASLVIRRDRDGPYSFKNCV